MSLPEILIYSELLSNIRQISVFAVLPTSSDNNTTATLSSDRQRIILQHEGHTTTLKLPGQVDSTSQIQPVAVGKTELSWRLPLAGQPSRPDAQDTEAPWSAKDLDVLSMRVIVSFAATWLIFGFMTMPKLHHLSPIFTW